MPANASFAYAIFKRLQAAYYWVLPTGGGHMAPDNAAGLFGGFSLAYPDDPHGMVGGSLSAAAPNFPQPGYTLTAGLAPLVTGDNTPANNPLYVLLAASLGPDGTIPDSVTVAGQKWPVMPPPEQVLPAPALGNQTNGIWLEFNAGAPKLIDALALWITNGKPDDSPKSAPLAGAALAANPPPPFPTAKIALLFVASFAGDDGRRNGDGEVAGVPLGHVPANFWATSQIFLCDAQGVIQNPGHLDMGATFTVAAMVGNSSSGYAGRAVFPSSPMHVLCDAQCFNTFLSPGVPLPALCNLDPADMSPTYDQLYMGPLSYDVVGFRFDVDAVFSGLAAALVVNNVNLGGASPAQWLKDGHPCVKVRITSGEEPGFFPPQGNVPLTLASDPRKDRHIAQRNLAPFDTALMAKKGVHWTNFIVAQAGAGMNGLAPKHDLPADAARFYLAVPTQVWKRYVAKAGHRGFEVVRDVHSKPFPDAVILRETAPGGRLEILDHAREPFFGLALGVEGLKPARPGDIALYHAMADGTIAGGFTLRPQAT
jgi:hypothetical protein